MSFQVACDKCGASLRILETTTSPDGIITVKARCPSKRWNNRKHTHQKFYSRDASLWTRNVPYLLLRRDKATYTHHGTPLTLVEGDSLEITYDIHTGDRL